MVHPSKKKNPPIRHLYHTLQSKLTPFLFYLFIVVVFFGFGFVFFVCLRDFGILFGYLAFNLVISVIFVWEAVALKKKQKLNLFLCLVQLR
jgi:hypothetical protein